MPFVSLILPWTSLSGGGYLVTPLNLLKRQPTTRAKQLLKKADMTIVFSAVNAMQSTPYRINQKIYPVPQLVNLNRTISEDRCSNFQTASRLESVERIGWRSTSPTATERTKYLLTNA